MRLTEQLERETACVLLGIPIPRFVGPDNRRKSTGFVQKLIALTQDNLKKNRGSLYLSPHCRRII